MARCFADIAAPRSLVSLCGFLILLGEEEVADMVVMNLKDSSHDLKDT